jgi:hypothetical protein
MAYLKSQYKKMQSGGAVAPDEPPREPSVEERINALNLPEHAREFIRKHETLVTDEAVNARATAVHDELLAEGHRAYGPSYMREMETRMFGEPEADDTAKHDALLVSRRVQRNAPQPDMPLSPRGYSAPVSRETPSTFEDLQRGSRGGNSITLGPAEKEAAKIAGVSEAEYAYQLVRLRDLKRDGFYGGGQ